MTDFADLPGLLLAPLQGRPAGDWHRAPEGKWTPAQILEHLAISVDFTSRKFEERASRGAMKRRPRGVLARLAGLSIIRLGWYPVGFTAPEGTRPGARPDPAAVEQRFREGHARFLRLSRALLPARGHDLFVKHPVIGDLTLEEWMRFHVVHCLHHLRQIHARLGR